VWEKSQGSRTRSAFHRLGRDRERRRQVVEAVRAVLPELRPFINFRSLDDIWMYFFDGALGYLSAFEDAHLRTELDIAAGLLPPASLGDEAQSRYRQSLKDWADSRVAFEQLCGHGPDTKYCALGAAGHGIERFGAYSAILKPDLLASAPVFRGNAGRFARDRWDATDEAADELWRAVTRRTATTRQIKGVLAENAAEWLRNNQHRESATTAIRSSLGSEYSPVEVYLHGTIDIAALESVRVHPGKAEELEDAAKAWLADPMSGDAFAGTRRSSRKGQGKAIISEAKALARLAREGTNRIPGFRVEPAALHAIGLELFDVIG